LYKLGEIGTGTISHDLNRWWARVRGRQDPFVKIGEINDQSRKGSSDWVWALKDIDFNVKQGEVMGIIGRNGAGKSTLLKILSKVTRPTTGRIKTKGRIASLLEVGTGFHPELTGRENIFLNGAILGMSKTEIRSKFDEIVDFSGVERYIDTPVKRYSSGMYVRLAFAVAAFLEPEILIVDEVLAVGDTEFQKKCLGKMNEVSKQEGRTVLFVSHDLGSVVQLCGKSILLDAGKIVETGATAQVIKKYLQFQRSGMGYTAEADGKSNFIQSIQLMDSDAKESYSYAHDDSITLLFSITINSWCSGMCLAFAIQNRFNKRVGLDFVEIQKEQLSKGTAIRVRMTLPAGLLAPGSFAIDASIISPNIEAFDLVYGKCPFEIVDNNSRITRFSTTDYGDVFLKTETSFD